MTSQLAHPYQAYYCEENVWHLAQHPSLAQQARRVVFISNSARTCALWHQRAAHEPGHAVVWDYHVILLAGQGEHGPWQVWDLDTVLGMPLPFDVYMAGTFGAPDALPPRFRARFRVMGAEQFLATFSTTREHMRDERGDWLKSPPPWPSPQARPDHMNLMRFVDLDAPFVGDVLPLDAFWRRFTTIVAT